MKNTILFFGSIFLLSFAMVEKKKIKIFLAGDSTIAIKDTKAFPETGWGMPFVQFWDSTVTVVNKAKNGRSTKTFLSEGLWKSIMDEAKEGDYVIIQFGHNDESVEKKERYSTPDTFKMNLNRFIKETREKKATPILFTPVSRRKFDKDGKAVATHEQYSALVREVAKETGVLFIDLDEKSKALYQQFGPEHSKLLFLQLQPGEHPNYPEGKNDNTHFNELGARMIAQIVLKELRNLDCGLTERIIVREVKK
ncbi:MAG TPA: rhamnogalacturonan acetylesterase [Chitinophagaceae bacterium]|nr:rhamnogalacturonan acetylesterase [Chitinophagaceae bacterium]HNU14718.1 rhamnogalacturonan acetylesterase [Chitinophagaceae bacterium]